LLQKNVQLKAKMPTQRRQIRRPAVDKTNPYVHLLMGYVFLALVFLGAISSVYYWEYKAKVRAPEGPALIKHVGSGEQVPDVEGAACEEKVILARQKQTGEVREFPTTCHVDKEWWEIMK
jgi:hypothetical protein